MAESCIFCKIASGAIPCAKVWESERLLAFLDISPVNPGHTLLIPKGHVESVFSLGSADYAEIFEAARRLSGPLLKATGSKRIGVIIEGFLIPHAHVHLVPINRGGELSFERAKKADMAGLVEMARRIREQL